MGVSKKVALDKDQKYTIGYSFKNKMGISANNFVILELIKDGSIMYTRKLQATEATTFDYTAPATGEYTWRMRSSSIGTTTTQPLTYSLDNLSIFYTYPYTVENCDNLADGYRFGFNAQEKDDEVYGEGNLYNFGARVHDPRLGRFLSVDPLYRKNVASSTYSFASNNVISCIDKNGMDSFLVITQPVTGTNTLQMTTIIKVSEDGENAIKYINNGTSGEWSNDFTTREGKYLNSSATKYSSDPSVTNGMAMALSRYNSRSGTATVRRYSAYVSSRNDRLTGSIFFDFKVSVLFNTDMSDISPTSLQSGTFANTMRDINEVRKIFSDKDFPYSSIFGEKRSKDFTKTILSIKGETDSRPSNYKGVGNTLLQWDRGFSLMNAIGANSSNSCINPTSNSGECNDEDRNSTTINVSDRK